jgi:hypothetical protein
VILNRKLVCWGTLDTVGATDSLNPETQIPSQYGNTLFSAERKEEAEKIWKSSNMTTM